MKNTPGFLVVIGTSAGGFVALDELVQQFKEEDDAGYCIIMHLSNPDFRSFLIKRLQALTALPCHVADDGADIQKGHIYIAQPGCHLLVKDGKLLLGRGQQEDTHRPSIDILFRSAAADYNVNAIGVILTGCVRDGTSGMEAIKGFGGTLIIQDPSDAEYSGMPQSVDNNSEVDYCVTLKNIGAAITNVINTKADEKSSVSPQLASEVRWSEKMALGIGTALNDDDERISYTCPECGHPLKKIEEDGELWYYYCPAGHISLKEDNPHINASEGVWVAVQLMEDRKQLFINKAAESRKRQMYDLGVEFTRKADHLRQHIDQLKTLLMEMEPR